MDVLQRQDLSFGAYILSLTGRVAGCRGPRLSCNAVLFQAAPVFIRAAVATPGKKIHRHGDVVAAIEIDQVEAGIPGTEDGVAVPTSKLANIIEVHGTRLNGVMTAGHRRVRRPEWNFARLVVGKRRGIADKFDAGQCTMIVHRIGPVPHAYDVILIP